MEAKEKAKELFDKYFLLSENANDEKGNWFMSSLNKGLAKQCALIAIDEVKWFHERLFYLTEESMFDKYLQDVKKEIENL